MMTDRERIPLMLRRTTRGLEPMDQLAADMLGVYAINSDVEVTVKKRRSLPQLRLYWAALQNFVEATGAYPTAEHAHDALKLDLGYTMPIKTLAGDIVFMPDSAAFGRMGDAQFKAFFDRAMARIAEVYGIDPLALGAAA